METVGVGRLGLRHGAGMQLLLPGARIVIGRGAHAHLRLDDAQVSRQHALVTVDERGVCVEDLGSANGTYVDGERIAARTELRLGSRIRIGEQDLAVVRATREDIVTLRERRATPGPSVPPGPHTTHGDVLGAEAMLAGCESLLNRGEWIKAALTFDDAAAALLERACRLLPLPPRALDRLVACASSISENASNAGGLPAVSRSVEHHLVTIRRRPLTFTERRTLHRLEALIRERTLAAS